MEGKKKSMYRASFHYVFVRILHVSCNLSCSFPAYDTCDHTLSSVFIAVENFPKMSQLKQKRKGIICTTVNATNIMEMPVWPKNQLNLSNLGGQKKCHFLGILNVN